MICKYVKASNTQVEKMRERVSQHHTPKFPKNQEAQIIEFLLNEQGFTIYKEKSYYG
jgi:regulator of sirC expression with transglutaminase-like and TPR domain